MDGTVTAQLQSADGTTIEYRTLGAGEPLLVIGGALRAADDYLPLGASLAETFRVHLVERRGRGASGPLGEGYALERECEDLEAVQRATGARSVFGHSYGGLIALETARRTGIFERVVVYEPGVSVDGSVPTGWLPAYRARLDRNDRREAFAVFVRGSGHAPAMLARLPEWYTRLVLRMAVAGRRWARIEPLLSANLVEHEQVARFDGAAERWRDILATVDVLAGSRSPAGQREGLRQLVAAMPRATLHIVDGLDHNAPDEKAPAVVAREITRCLRGSHVR